MVSPLMSLPAEIREHIFGFVLIPYWDDSSSLTVSAGEEPKKPKYRWHVAILRTNRKISAEATRAFVQTNIFVKLELPFTEPRSIHTVHEGDEADKFTGRAMDVSFEIPPPDVTGLNDLQASLVHIHPATQKSRYVILAQDLERFVTRAVLSDSISTGIALTSRIDGTLPTKIRLHLRDPRPADMRPENAPKPFLSPEVQKLLLLPFADFNSRNISDEERDLLPTDVPTSIDLTGGTSLIDMKMDVTAEPGLDVSRVKKELLEQRDKPIDPKMRLRKAGQLIFGADRMFEAGHFAQAEEQYRRAFAAMDVVTDVESCNSVCSRAYEYNVMIGDVVYSPDDPGRLPQNLLPDGTVVSSELFKFQHWRIPGICCEDDKGWNHAAWQREELRMAATARMVWLLQRTGRREDASAWAMMPIILIRLGHAARRDRDLSPGLIWDLDISPVEEAHLNSPGRQALGEIYYRAAALLPESDTDEARRECASQIVSLLRVAAVYLAESKSDELVEYILEECPIVKEEKFLELIAEEKKRSG